MVFVLAEPTWCINRRAERSRIHRMAPNGPAIVTKGPGNHHVTEESRKSLPPVGLIVAALLLHLLPFVSRPALIGGDEAHYALAAHSVGTDHDLDLTEWAASA